MTDTPWSGTRELWALNPGPAIDIAFDHGITNFVFSERTYQFKRNMRLDPERQLTAAARGRPWRAILVEYDSNMAVEFTSVEGFKRHVGAYRCWDASRGTRSDLFKLLAVAKNQPGDLVGSMAGDGHGMDFHIVENQPKRILITGSPGSNIDWNGSMKSLGLVKYGFPDWTFHFHAGKSLRRTLGIGVDSFDHPIRTRWENGLPGLVLPNGTEHRPDQKITQHVRDWARMIGMDVQKIYDTEDHREMSRMAYQFSLRSIKWLFMNYDNAWKPGRGGLADGDQVDIEVSDFDWEPLDEPVWRLHKGLPVLPHDRWLCDTCSLITSCPFSRPGAVCIVEGSEAVTLATRFKSRRSSDIIDALGGILAKQAERAERGLEVEQANDGMLSAHVTKILEGLFDRGIQLAKLVDPTIAHQMSNGSKVNIINGVPVSRALAASTPQELMSLVVAELSKEGIKIDEASVDDVEKVIARMGSDEILDVESDEVV